MIISISVHLNLNYNKLNLEEQKPLIKYLFGCSMTKALGPDNGR
jgi:hypothetical protein